MSEKNIFKNDIEVPDIVQKKANIAFSDIRKKGPTTMRKKQFIKPLIAVAACVVLVTGAIVSDAIFNVSNHETESKADNMFSLRVMASELKPGKPVPLSSNGNYKPFSIEMGESGDFNYYIYLPLAFEGNNIDTITYLITNDASQSGIQEEKYITLDYPKESDVYSYINIGDGILDKKELQDTIQDDNSTLEEKNEAINKLLNNTVIKCTANYSDGTSEDVDILVKSQIMNCQEAGETSADPSEMNTYITFEIQ